MGATPVVVHAFVERFKLLWSFLLGFLQSACVTTDCKTMLHGQGSMGMTDRIAGSVTSRVYGTCGHSVSFSYAGLRILVSSLAFNVVFALLIALCGKMF